MRFLIQGQGVERESSAASRPCEAWDETWLHIGWLTEGPRIRMLAVCAYMEMSQPVVAESQPPGTTSVTFVLRDDVLAILQQRAEQYGQSLDAAATDLKAKFDTIATP